MIFPSKLALTVRGISSRKNLLSIVSQTLRGERALSFSDFFYDSIDSLKSNATRLQKELEQLRDKEKIKDAEIAMLREKVETLANQIGSNLERVTRRKRESEEFGNFRISGRVPEISDELPVENARQGNRSADRVVQVRQNHFEELVEKPRLDHELQEPGNEGEQPVDVEHPPLRQLRLAQQLQRAQATQSQHEEEGQSRQISRIDGSSYVDCEI